LWHRVSLYKTRCHCYCTGRIDESPYAALATYHPRYPTPSSAAPEFSPLGIGNMLRNATFLGFRAIDKTLFFGITPYFIVAYVNFTYKHSF